MKGVNGHVLVTERLSRRVLAFSPVDKGGAKICIKEKFFNLSHIYAHAPMEVKVVATMSEHAY